MLSWWRNWKKRIFNRDGETEGPSLTNKTEKPGKGKKNNELSFTHWVLILALLGLAAVILSNYFTKEEPRNHFDEFVGQDHLQTEEPEQNEVTMTSGMASNDLRTLSDYEDLIENQLKEMLSKIKGVGEVSVMVTLDASAEKVVEKNMRKQDSETVEEDREGGKRTIVDHQLDEQVVVLRQKDHEEPIVVKTNTPRVRGVLVVAPGAENVQVKAWITEAVQRVLDVPAHKVSVLPKQ